MGKIKGLKVFSKILLIVGGLEYANMLGYNMSKIQKKRIIEEEIKKLK